VLRPPDLHPRRRAEVAAGLLAVGAVLAACAGAPALGSADRAHPAAGLTGSPAPGTPAGTASSTAAGRPAGTTPPPTPGPPTPGTPTRTPRGPIRLAFAGDVHFADQVAALLDHPQDSLADLRPFLAGADLTVVNLETAITTRGTPQAKKYHFRTAPAALDALRAAGVDAVTMANNHAVDYGEVGLKDTLAARAASPVPIVGIGKDAAAAYAPAMFDVRGLKIALLGATQVPDWTRATWPAKANRPGVALSLPGDRLLAAVRAARKKADVVVVYLHWGTNYVNCPDADQVRTMTALRKAGVDIIVGAHAHRIQGSGWMGKTYVAYGLGNFIWYGSQEPDSRTGVLTVTLDAKGRPVDQAWQPLLVSPDGVPRPPDAAGQARIEAGWLAARRCAHLSSAPGTS